MIYRNHRFWRNISILELLCWEERFLDIICSLIVLRVLLNRVLRVKSLRLWIVYLKGIIASPHHQSALLCCSNLPNTWFEFFLFIIKNLSFTNVLIYILALLLQKYSFVILSKLESRMKIIWNVVAKISALLLIITSDSS